jgi:hypothetical protein
MGDGAGSLTGDRQCMLSRMPVGIGVNSSEVETMVGQQI